MGKETAPYTLVPTDFEGWWNVPEMWVEEPNKRRNGWSGMIRLTIGLQTYYIKKQCNHLYRSLRHPFGWPTVSREYDNIRRLMNLGLNVPQPVFHGTRRSEQGFEAILVTEELAGYASLDRQEKLTADEIGALARATGRSLGKMHRAHLQHGCLYDKHIMARWQSAEPDIALIDLEKLKKPFFSWRAARHDLEQLKRHQSIWTPKEWLILEEAHTHGLLE